MKPWKQEVIAIAMFWPSQFQKDCYNVTYIYIISISLSLSAFLKRLVLLFGVYLPNSCVTGFCNKLGVFCNIVTRVLKVLSLKVLPSPAPEVIVAPPARCNVESKSFKLKSFRSLGSPALAHTRSLARSPALANYYDVFQTDNTNTDTKVETKKSPPKRAKWQGLAPL